jgi:hypothetical protein
MPNLAPDFEAEVRFLTPEEGGRSEQYGPVKQGYRCDIHFEDDPSDLLWMIWPKFLNESGDEVEGGTIIPRMSRAHFYIVNQKAKPLLYRRWLRENARFHLREGRRGVAACRVTKLMSPYEDDITKFDASQIQWREPWQLIPMDYASRFEAELYREMNAGHILYGRSFAVIGRRKDCDDFLFYLGDKPPRFAVVHLTFQCETRPEWPKTSVFDSLAALMEQRILPDAENYAL